LKSISDGLAALAHHAATLTLSHATPNAFALTVVERVLEAGLFHWAGLANRLCWGRSGIIF
jgi:hypothetical protein